MKDSDNGVWEVAVPLSPCAGSAGIGGNAGAAVTSLDFIEEGRPLRRRDCRTVCLARSTTETVENAIYTFSGRQNGFDFIFIDCLSILFYDWFIMYSRLATTLFSIYLNYFANQFSAAFTTFWQLCCA